MIAQQIQTTDVIQMKQIPRLLLDSRGAQATLTMSERTLHERTRDGTIPHLKIGRLVRYPVLWLERWIESQMPAELSDVESED